MRVAEQVEKAVLALVLLSPYSSLASEGSGNSIGDNVQGVIMTLIPFKRLHSMSPSAPAPSILYLEADE
jgi:hypothetical protein